MKISTLFLQRYDPLHNNYLAGFWEQVTPEQMRTRPHARVNSIAWNLWHIARVEDAGINRFLFDGVQVFDEGGWGERMNLPWRHHGSGMSLEEVDELDQCINITALHEYSMAVEARTRSTMGEVDVIDLDARMEETYLRRILVDEGLAHDDPEGFIQNYLGWSKGKCLLTYGLTHSWQHLGEMEVIASLLGVDFG